MTSYVQQSLSSSGSCFGLLGHNTVLRFAHLLSEMLNDVDGIRHAVLPAPFRSVQSDKTGRRHVFLLSQDGVSAGREFFVAENRYGIPRLPNDTRQLACTHSSQVRQVTSSQCLRFCSTVPTSLQRNVPVVLAYFNISLSRCLWSPSCWYPSGVSR